MKAPNGPNLPHRRSIRSQGYDYSQPGAYFLTVCAYNNICIFGEIIDGVSKLNNIGRIVEEEWLRSARIRAEIKLDSWVIMPNHFHAVVFITGNHDRLLSNRSESNRTKSGSPISWSIDVGVQIRFNGADQFGP